MTNREKFEAWWEVNYHNGNPPRFGWEAWRDGDGYKIDDDESELDGMWQSWQAAESASEQQLEESQREFRAADATIHNLELQLTDMAVQLANAESKCRELAGVVAENAALKDGVNKAIEDIQCFYDSYGWHVSEDGESETAVVALDDANGSIEHFALSVKTPATDAFLAEVRAQCVESGINTVIAMMNHQHPATSQAIDILQTHAAQLRKGAAL